ncbi:unnamed protein product, partial [Amoebophrya sp. A25]
MATRRCGMLKSEQRRRVDYHLEKIRTLKLLALSSEDGEKPDISRMTLEDIIDDDDEVEKARVQLATSSSLDVDPEMKQA